MSGTTLILQPSRFKTAHLNFRYRFRPSDQEIYMAKMIHSMIRVLDEQRSVYFYHRAFRLNIMGRSDFTDVSLTCLANDETPFELELTVNYGRDMPYERGNKYGHLVFSIDDLDAGHARLTELGFNPRKRVEFATEG